MKRYLFFLFEKLQITSGERYLITGLMVLALIINGIQAMVPASNPYDHAFYEPLMVEFERRATEKNREDSLLMARYYPPIVTDIPKPVDATVLSDSLGSKNTKKRLVETDSTGLNGININTAALDQLITLPGIGPGIGERIIAYRDANGPFSTIESIMNVKGIGAARFEQIKPYIRVSDNPGE